MQQQINLYYLLPKKTGFELTLSMALSVYSVFFLILFSIFLAVFFQKNKLVSQYHHLNNQVIVLQKQLNDLTQKYPVIEAVTLQRAVEELRQHWESKIRMMHLLKKKSHFSEYLGGLANVSVPDVWLTEINFNAIEEKITLNGLTLQSHSVEKLLEQLDSQSVFSNLKFQLENISETTEPLSFFIVSKEKENSG